MNYNTEICRHKNVLFKYKYVKMKEKINLQPLLFLALLFIAGTISPSNNLDDKISKTPLELILIVLVVNAYSITAYSVSNYFERMNYAENKKIK